MYITGIRHEDFHFNVTCEIAKIIWYKIDIPWITEEPVSKTNQYIDNGLSPGRCQAITWTNAGILLIGPLWTNFSEILIRIQIFQFKKTHFKMSSWKWLPFWRGLNVLRPGQNGRHFPDGIFKSIFLNENVWFFIKIHKFVPKWQINNVPSLVQIMAWRRSGDRPLSEPIMVSLDACMRHSASMSCGIFRFPGSVSS